MFGEHITLQTFDPMIGCWPITVETVQVEEIVLSESNNELDWFYALDAYPFWDIALLCPQAQ